MMKAVIFDMDGVIIDSEPLWTKATRNVLKNKISGSAVSYAALKKELCGKTMAESTEILKKTYGLKEPTEGINEEIKRELIAVCEKELKLESGLPELAEKLKASGFKLAIASASPPIFVDYVIEKFGLAGMFDTVLSCDQVKKGKPAPDVFLHAAKMLGVRPEECMVIEDAPNGVEAAKRAGM
jgi:HAD superfamily hydrolase (TIGR01509 family)